MIDAAGKSIRPGRETLAWFSFAAFFIAFVGLGSVFIFRDIPRHLGIDMQRPLGGWEVLCVVGLALMVIILLFYLGAIAWLLFAKLFLSKAEVSKVVFYGPTTRFDRWLVDTVFPN